MASKIQNDFNSEQLASVKHFNIFSLADNCTIFINLLQATCTTACLRELHTLGEFRQETNEAPPLSTQGSRMQPRVTPDIDPRLKSPSAVCVRVYSHGRVCCHTPCASVCVCAPGFRRRGADLWPATIFCGLSVTATAATSSRCGESISAAICSTEFGAAALKPLATQTHPQILILPCHLEGVWLKHMRGHSRADGTKSVYLYQ